MIYNFEYCFVIPCYDKDLIDLIKSREEADYTGCKDDLKRIAAIMDRIDKLNGLNLFWS